MGLTLTAPLMVDTAVCLILHNLTISILRHYADIMTFVTLPGTPKKQEKSPPPAELVKMSSLAAAANAHVNPQSDRYDEESSGANMLPNDSPTSKTSKQAMETDGTDELS